MKRKGFTLIEILVVVTIIGLLYTIASTTYSQLSKRSRDARRKGDIEQIRAAMEMYRGNNNSYPSATVNCSSTTGISDTDGTYLSKMPHDPRCSNYTYYLSVSSNDYTIGAYLEGISSSCSVTISCGNANCNYCLGPYGEK